MYGHLAQEGCSVHESTSAMVAPENLSAALASAVSRLQLDAVPEDVIGYLKLCIADAVGIAFASHHYAFAQRAFEGVATLGSSGEATVIGCESRYAPRDAALLNGLLIHGLDFDDTHLGSVIHCTASALPPVLSTAEAQGLSGADLLVAVLAAIEVDARLGSLAGGTFQQIGFHPTGLVSIFGATLAVSRCLGSGTGAMIHAQGIALSMASGSMAFLDDGSWTKRLHPGWAASSALTAAALGHAGFEGPAEAYAGRYGFYSLYTRNADIDLAPVTDQLFERWEMGTVAIKPYPVCHFNHAAIDAALALRAEHGLTPDSIKRVTVQLHERQFSVVCEPELAKKRPQSEYDAKFSIQYAVATALVKGRFGLAELDLECRTDPGILALCERISFEHCEESRFPDYFSGGVRIETRSGETLCSFEQINRGAVGRQLSEQAVKEKFLQNVELTADRARAEQLWTAIMQLEEQPDTKELLSAIRGGVRSSNARR